jgi:hypothetical protein
MSCTDYLVFQTQEPANVKCGKTQALKHGLDPALSVKTYTADSFLLLSISKCYNKFWCIITQPVICISAWLSCTTNGIHSVTVARNYLSTTTTTKPHCRLQSMANPHVDDTEFLDAQSSGVVVSVLALHMSELIWSYSWVDVRILDHVLCSARLHNNALVTLWAVQYIHCTLLALL